MATRKFLVFLLPFLLLAAVPQSALAIPVTVTLAVAPVSPTQLGAVVTLTATVPSGSGVVSFLDAGTLIGSATISGGTATLANVFLPAGARRLRAFYAAESLVSDLVVHTVTTVAANHFSPAVAATNIFTPTGPFAVSNRGPNPELIYLTTENDGTVCYKQPSATSCITANPIPNPESLVTADFNLDGLMDAAMVVRDTSGSFVQVFLRGTGTKRYATGNPVALATGDFNGDGRADLLVANAGLGVSILNGQADGTFLSGGSDPSGGSASIVVGDFNGDGKADLATINGSSGFLEVLFGAGNNTFTKPVTYTISGSPARQSLATGDFDGDGKLDLAVADSINARIHVILGNGDTTFRSILDKPIGPGTHSIAVGDFNGDGKLDLAAANSQASTIKVFLGNGDGTLQDSQIISHPNPGTIAVADLNGDGKADLIVSNPAISVLYGSSLVAAISEGDAQSVAIGGAFAQLKVLVTDNGNPVTGASVTFTAPASGASATVAAAPVVTGADGIAASDATANNTAGGYAVSATVDGLTLNFNLTNTVGQPAIMTITGGSPQTTPTGQPFLSPLQLKVTDAGSNPLSGVTVTFAAPASGASANLSATTATTNADGIVSINAAANTTAGNYAVVATAGALSVPFILGNIPPQAATLTVIGGSPQSTAVGTVFPVALQVVLKNSAGASMSGVTVTFTAPANGPGATLSSSSVVTDSEGKANVTATANSQVGSFSVVAIASGTGEGSISTSFSLTNTAGQTASVTVAGGTPQSTVIGQPFTSPLQVLVKDAAGNPSSGVTVTFAAAGSGPSATLSSSQATTNASGIASVNATANGTPGVHVVTASVGARSATFNLSNLSGGPVSISATGGAQQTVPIGSAFAPLQVTVRDAGSNPLANVVVTFSAPGTGASANLGAFTALTNASGVASVAATANQIQGSYTVSALVPTVNGESALTANFALTNSGFPVAGVVPVAGTPQSTVISTAFPIALQVRVRDANNNAMAGVTVTFGAPAGGASATLSSSTAVTNASGLASVTATANSTSGTYIVSATAGGVSGQFVLTNTAAQGGSLAATGGTPQAADLGAAFTAPLQATLRDVFGTPVGGAIVTFSVPAGGASATLSSLTAITNASGVASVNATANNTAGTYAVTATAGSLFTTFVLTNGSGGATNVAQGKSASQSSTITGYDIGGAAAAVDGNTAGGFFGGSVTHTNSDPNAWWQVDLGTNTAVSSIVIWNRTDPCCVNRLSDYWVFVSNTPFSASDTPATLQSRAGTVGNHQTSAPSPSTTIDLPAQGRYVRVQLAGTGNLSLAEVQVIGTPLSSDVNLVTGKTATQSSKVQGYAQGGASSAIDGNTDGNFFSGSVTHTDLENNPWWQVDLGGSANISNITIFNRTDCCGSRLSDYWIFISDTPFAAGDTPATLLARAGTWSNHQTTAPSPSSSIPVGSLGRYVRIQLSNPGNLSLAEVQVVGTPAAVVDTNLALAKTTTQSSTLGAYATAVASSAVDGNTDGNFFNGSVTHTNQENNPWWQVDLGASKTVASMTIWNRTDCCGSRLGDFWVFVSDIPFAPGDTPATLQARAGTFSNHQTAAPNAAVTIPVTAQGRYVRVQIAGPDGILSLAEVQVTGH